MNEKPNARARRLIEADTMVALSEAALDAIEQRVAAALTTRTEEAPAYTVAPAAEALTARATVPDAATEELRADKMTAEEAIESVLKRPGMYGLVDKEGHRCMKAERDAALAAVERVRAVHKPVEIEPSDTICGECSFQLPNGTYFGKVVEFPCDTRAALDGAPEPDPYDDFCPTCDAPNPWHTDTCAVPFRGSRSALDGAPEPEWEVQYGRRNRETGALHWLAGDPRDDWWHENQDRYEHVKRYTSPPLPVEGESKP